jgi:branched-chain amino acid transport system permease protein
VSRRSAQFASGALRAILALTILGLPLAGIVALASHGTLSEQFTVTNMLVNLVLVVGLYVFAGNSGILSFGHMSFMAIAAYVTALVTIPHAIKETLLPNLPTWLQNAQYSQALAGLAAAAVCGAFAIIIGIPLMRLSGIAAALSMFIVLLIVRVVANNWDSVTRGQEAMVGVPTTTTMTSALVGACVAILIAFIFQESRVGRRLRASREDEVAAKSLGINIIKERRIALLVSAILVGMGGFFFAGLQGTFSPDAFFLIITFNTIAMLVIGGMNSLSGAVIGTVLISALLEGLYRLEDGFSVSGLHVKEHPGLSGLGLAIVMIGILIFRPDGITRGREVFPTRDFVWWPKRRRAGDATVETAVGSTHPSGASGVPTEEGLDEVIQSRTAQADHGEPARDTSSI